MYCIPHIGYAFHTISWDAVQNGYAQYESGNDTILV